MIAIIDYGINNLRSVQKAFEAVDCPAEIVTDPELVRRAARVVLPGVGAIGDAMSELRRTGLGEAFVEAARAGKPCLGICLGMQLLFDRSDEGGSHQALGLIPGPIVRFEPMPGLKVPHMGWNTLEFPRPHPLFRGIEPGSYVYFVHSYLASTADPANVIATSRHGIEFPAAVARENVSGCQFHPEKSQAIGLEIYRNFASM